MSVRVPSTPQAALGLGFDAPAWVKERLVDTVVVTPRWATLEFDLPLAQWRELLGNDVVLAGGMEVRLSARPEFASAGHSRGGQRRGRGDPRRRSGHGIYLFNYFQDGHPGWPLSTYESTLHAAFGSLGRRLQNCRGGMPLPIAKS